MVYGNTAKQEPFNPGTGYNYTYQYAKPNNSENLEPDYPGCTRKFIPGQCESGHKFVKSIYCGKEYCPVCGQIDSDIHQRRKARWYSKVHSLKKVGYLVITIPYEARESFKDVKVLSDFRTFLKRKLQRLGYNKGLSRWHWFGDCKNGTKTEPCRGCKTCKGTGAGINWHPHLNFIIESGYMEKTEFTNFTEELKTDVIRWIKNRFKHLNHLKWKGNVNYSYRKYEKQINHTINYVTRSTFRIYNPEIADLLKGYRTTSTWGKFEPCDHLSENSELISLENSICPCCGGTVTWNGKELLTRSRLFGIGKKWVSGGYFILDG